MYINAALSFLNAWQKLQKEHVATLEEIKQAIMTMELGVRYSVYGPVRSLERSFHEPFIQLNWDAKAVTLIGKNPTTQRRVDFVKDGVGVDIEFAKTPYVLRNLVFTYPRFISDGLFRIAVIIMPMDFKTIDAARTSNYKEIYHEITNFYPIPCKYPFVIFGISGDYSEIKVEELTSELDTFLVETFGHSLEDMKEATEREQYDFKETLTLQDKTRPIFHPACALANQPGGGAILVGVDNSGNIRGIPRSELDGLRNKLTSTIRSNCKPCPYFEVLDFDDPSDKNKCVLVIHVRELDRKPCMADDKVYIRAGSQTVVAGSDEIRRLVIESLR